ncbi:MAG: hypothetical protein M9894_29280 [Planctomycetes bacterium]|nr:hypothetical protein [Planctomycetota bacterium]
MPDPGLRLPPTLRRAALRGAWVAAFNVVAMGLLVLCWFGREAADTTGRWDALFLALLGLVAAPVEVVVAWARARPPLVRLAAGLACGPLAALGLLAAHGQVSYAFALTRGLNLEAAMGASGRGLMAVAGEWSEARAALVAFAAPHAAVALARLFALRPAGQVAVALPASLLAAALALSGFVGLPLVGWLVSTPWLGPVVQTFVFLQPYALPLLLPVVDARLASSASSSAQEDRGDAAAT